MAMLENLNARCKMMNTTEKVGFLTVAVIIGWAFQCMKHHINFKK